MKVINKSIKEIESLREKISVKGYTKSFILKTKIELRNLTTRLDMLNNKLLIYAREGILEGVKECVEAGAVIHMENDTVLKLSAENGHLKVILYLTEVGVNINYGTILIFGAKNNHLNIVQYSFMKSTLDDINKTFIEATQYGHLEIVRYLIEKYRHNCNVYNPYGYCINVAVKYGHI